MSPSPTELKQALKIGELARRTGLTVRALHHYDSIGLLKPSARSLAGYRLYSRADIARLHQIQALRRFKLSLADIAALLSRPDAPFTEIIAQQIAALERQIEQATLLHEQLSQLQSHLTQGSEPDLTDWLSTLALMNDYDKYFSRAELKQLPFFQANAQRDQIWSGLVQDIKTLIHQGVSAQNPKAGQLAQRWMQQLEHDTAANPDFAQRITAMLELEPSAQQRTGITPQLKQYVIDALAAFKLAIYANYLDPDELRHMQEHGSKTDQEWQNLIAAVHQKMEANTPADEPAVQALSRQWFTLFQMRIGNNPATLSKIRLAHEQEPALLIGTWVNDKMLAFIRKSAATLKNE